MQEAVRQNNTLRELRRRNKHASVKTAVGGPLIARTVRSPFIKSQPRPRYRLLLLLLSQLIYI